MQSKRQQPSTNLFVWGNDTHGQLGLPQTPSNSHNLPKPLTMLHSIKSLSCGQRHIAFINHQGEVFTQGCNADGKLGVQAPKWSNVPVKVQLPCPAAKVQCGMAHTLCLLENGEVYGWGYGEKGALGTGEFKSRARPARVQIEGRVKQISAGAMHSAFLTNSGELFMCGANDNGELGLPRKGGICVPTAVPTKAKFMDVSCGIFYTLMLDQSGLVYAMGSNKYGQLGTGTKSPQPQPTILKSLQNQRIVKICTGYHSGALNDKGQLFLWGSGTFGQLLKPTKIKKPYPFVDLSIGGFFGCAVDSKHNVYTWGNNQSGQLGLGHFENCKELTEVAFLRGKNIGRVYCGVNFAFAVVGGQYVPQPTRGVAVGRGSQEARTDRLERQSLASIHNPSDIRELRTTILDLEQSQRRLISQRKDLQSKLELLSKDYQKLCNKYDLIEVIVSEKQKIIAIYETKIRELSQASDLTAEVKLLRQQNKRLNETIQRNAQLYSEKMRQKDDIILRLERTEADLIQQVSIMKGQLKLSQNLLKDRLQQDRFRQTRMDRNYQDIVRQKQKQIIELSRQNQALSKELGKWTNDNFRKHESLKATSGQIEALLRVKEEEEIEYIKKINKLECMLSDKEETIAALKRGGGVAKSVIFERERPSPIRHLDRTEPVGRPQMVRELTEELRMKDELITQLRRQLASSPVNELKTQRFSLVQSLKAQNQQLRDMVDRLRLKPETQMRLTPSSQLARQLQLSSQLKSQVDDLTFQLKCANKQIQHLQLSSLQKQKALQSDLQAMSSYRASLQNKQAQVLQKDQLIYNYQDQLKRSRAQLTVEKDVQKKSEEIIKRLSDEAGQLRKLLGKAEASLQVSNEEMELAKGEMDRLKRAKKDLEVRLLTLAETLERNQELETKLELANAQIALKGKAIKDLEKQIRDDNQAALNRQQELNIELRRVKDLKARKEIQCGELQDQKNRAIQKMQIALAETIRQKQTSLACLKKAQAATKALQLQRSNQQLRDNEFIQCKKQLTRYRIQKQQLSRNLQLLQSDYTTCQQKCSQYELKLTRAQRQLQSIQLQIQTNRDEARRLRQQLAEASEAVSEMNQVKTELMAANAEFARNEVEYVGKIEELERRTLDQRNQNEDYKPRYDALLQRNKELDQRNAELADMLNKAIEKHASQYKDRVLGDVARNAGNIYQHLKESVVLSNKKRRQQPEPQLNQHQSENQSLNASQPKTPPPPTKKQDPYKKLMSARISDHKRRISESALKLVQLLQVQKDSKNPMDTYQDYQKINDRIESIEIQKSNLLSKINSYAQKLKIL